MDELINLDQNGGFPIKSDDLRLLFGTDEFDAGVYNAFNSLLSAFGDNYIVSGCEYNSGTGLIAEGFVFLNGELLKVDEHPKTGDYFLKVTSEQTARTFKNGSNYNVHRENRAKAISSGGVLKYNYPIFNPTGVIAYTGDAPNANDLTNGRYFCSGSEISLGSNWWSTSTETGYYLIEVETYQFDYIYQKVTSPTGLIYTRSYNGSTWSDWNKLNGSEDRQQDTTIDDDSLTTSEKTVMTLTSSRYMPNAFINFSCNILSTSTGGLVGATATFRILVNGVEKKIIKDNILDDGLTYGVSGSVIADVQNGDDIVIKG